ncbi:MAG: glycoside hydrolase family 44 protein [Planctomycetota bacterium]
MDSKKSEGLLFSLSCLILFFGIILLSLFLSHPARAQSTAAPEPSCKKKMQPVIPPAEPPLSRADKLNIYDDSLSSGWVSWSWGTTLDFDNPDPVQSGTASIAVTFDQAWAGLYLNTNDIIPGTSYHKLRFSIHGGLFGDHELNVVLVDEDYNIVGSTVHVTSAAGAWTEVELSISQLGMPAGISGIIWQESSGSAQPTFFLDNIEFIKSPHLHTPDLCIINKGGPSLTIDAGSAMHAIDPDIYGMNFADAALATDLRLPVRRWGGNSTTRYNWQNDTSNRASDWFFENIPNANSNPGILPDGSETDRFVEQNMATFTRSLLTLPLIGWTPKAREFACGFSVNKYGAQQEVDPWAPDAGNGIFPDGTYVTGNDPLDTSVAIDPTFVQAWMNHLIGKYGPAGSGGVKYYNLDNEPMLWNSTHRDVHPEAASYDEMRDRTWSYGSAIKAADPGALTLGPTVWGWVAYFYSALDAEPGGEWWLDPQDRNAHGGVPFVEWYLQQMQAYEQANGVRILDYLDLHFYPQAPGVTLSGAGNAATQALRLRSTRALWDPTYEDESWIQEPVQLIQRMHDWVSQNYPGTKLAITEYNWGAFDHINGALAQADVLGLFGREGVDLASLWSVPDFDDPVAFAFRMYRNYDGSGNGFGNTSVSASSADQDRLSVYAALRNLDSALTVMMINKSGQPLDSRISILDFAPAGSAEVYRYSGADLGAIHRQADMAVTAGVIDIKVPSDSITLLVLAPQEAP